MKLVNLTKCNNDSICNNLLSERKSIILTQRVTRNEKNIFRGLKEITQSKTLTLPLQSQILITVKIEIDNIEWKTLSSHIKNTVWIKLRKKLYWSCESSSYVPSLCIDSQPKVTPIFIIRIFDASTPLNKQSYIQCSICFLNSSVTEIISWDRVSQHLLTLAFNLHKFLPKISLTEIPNIIINVTRVDMFLGDDDPAKIFITNISIIDKGLDTLNPKEDCKFFCGWGPQCLDNVAYICDGEINCAEGEDEDIRLCNAFKLDAIRSTTKLESKSVDLRIMTIFNIYLLVTVFIVILLIIMISFAWFICRSQDFNNRINHKKSKLPHSIISTHDCNTICTTCERKSRRNLINDYQSGESFKHQNDMVNSLNPKPLIVNERKISKSEIPKCYYNKNINLSMQKDWIYKERHDDVNMKDDQKTSEWLNLFLRVYSEAPLKVLLNGPPNVNKKIGYNLCSTSSTDVFPVMI